MGNKSTQFQKGDKGNKKGRPKGTPNAVSADIVDSILRAACERGGGGPDGVYNYLVSLDEKLFTGCLVRIIPKDINLNAKISGIDELLKAHASRNVE